MHCSGLQPHLLASNGMQYEIVIGQEHAVIPDMLLQQPCACLEQICEGELPVLDELAAVPEDEACSTHAWRQSPAACNTRCPRWL